MRAVNDADSDFNKILKVSQVDVGPGGPYFEVHEGAIRAPWLPVDWIEQEAMVRVTKIPHYVRK